jgi:DNA sulfur modification protein DndC
MWFRWCTDRLKINPATKFILEKVRNSGEVVILLGARTSESASRAQTMEKYEIKNFKYRKHTTIPGAFVYTPIEDLDTVMVWSCLRSAPSPWGNVNEELEKLYRKADSECPLVVDKNTPSCGGSRFGCWVCTVVDRDRSVEGLIEEGETWLQPMLDFRNWLKDIRNDSQMRESIRKQARKSKWMSDYLGTEGKEDVHRGHKVLGPFTFESRLAILKKLLELQEGLKHRSLQLITSEEIRAIETIWAYEGGPTSALVELISHYSSSSTERPHTFIDFELRKELAQICDKYNLSIDLFENLLIAEGDLSSVSRSNGSVSKLEKVIYSYIEMQAISGGK